MPGFDVVSARKAGYADPEILDYLADGADYSTLPGTPDEQIATLMRLRNTRMLPVENAPAYWTQPAVPQPRAPVYQIPPDLPTNLSDLQIPREQVIGSTLTSLMRAGDPLTPYAGGGQGFVTLSDLADIPESKAGAALTLAAMLPGGKIIKAVGKGVKKGLTGEAIVKEAANPKPARFEKWRAQNQEAGTGVFDLTNPQPALTGRPPVPRYEPPRGVPARVAEAIEDPKVLRTLRETVEAGREIMPQSWYRTGPLYERFKQIYGSEEAASAAFQRYMQYVAATSPGSDVPTNIRTGSLYNWMARQGMPFPEKPPSGYGHKYQGTQRGKAVRLLEEGQLDPYSDPKTLTFSENLMGNELPVTIDRHNFRMLGIAAKDPRFLAPVTETGFKPREAYKRGELTLKEALKHPSYWATAPNDTEYGAYERVQQAMARKMGISPADLQGWMWVGGGAKTGLASPPEPFMQTLAARIAYTAARMGVSPEVVRDKFIKGEIPLLSAGAGAVGVGLLSQQEPEAQ